MKTSEERPSAASYLAFGNDLKRQLEDVIREAWESSAALTDNDEKLTGLAVATMTLCAEAIASHSNTSSEDVCWFGVTLVEEVKRLQQRFADKGVRIMKQ